MTSQVIYHDFQQTTHPETATVLTARVLAKGRRWHKFWGNFNRVTENTCIFLCGACVAVGVAIFCQILYC